MNTKQGRFPFTSIFTILIIVLLSTFMNVDAMDAGTQHNLLSPDDSGPTIDVWYEDSLVLSFGDIGTPQDQINILGNVSDPQGVKTLTFSLNGGDERNLEYGPDTRRLANTGDFNVEIFNDDSDLIVGANSLAISATDNSDNLSQVTVTVNYTDVNTWPPSYSTDWGTATSIEEEAQVVDGLWDIVAGGVRTTEPGYDRLIAIGDVDWDDYEVTVPVTINEMPGESAGLGIMMRWNGHTDNPVSGWQPKSGWIPFGAVGWYRWLDDYFDDRLQIYGNEGHILAEDISGRKLVQGTTYIFKMRVETIPGQGSLYTLKVWEQGDSEPSGWDLMGQADVSDPSNGSLLLLAHRVDATFGDVSVQPLGNDTTDPTISNIQVIPGLTSAIVSWETDEPTTGKVDYGPTAPSYSLGPVNDPDWGIKHSVLLTGLNTNSTYHFKIIATDTSNNKSNSGDKTLKTESKASTSGIDSDDFNDCSLDTDLWSFIDPVGDSSVTIMNGLSEHAWANIDVPGGTDHDLWIQRYDAPRILQPASNADFEIEVKFESDLDQIHQLQGILVEESQPEQTYLRFGFYYDGTTNKTVIYAAGYIDGMPIVKNDQYINSGNPLYMRVKRQGDTWTQKYSYNGTSWTTSRTFIHPIHVNAVGTYAGNAADPSLLLLRGAEFQVFEDYHYPSTARIDLQSASAGAPAHNGYIDYFFNVNSPIVPEDNDRNSLTVNVFPSGSGSVQIKPNKSNYSCDEGVELKAIPNNDWYFTSWSGDLGGSTNPANITMKGEREITANFTQIVHQIFMALISKE